MQTHVHSTIATDAGRKAGENKLRRCNKQVKGYDEHDTQVKTRHK